MIKRVLLLLSGLTIGCLAGELLLRLFNYEGLNLMAKDPLLGQRYKAGITTTIFDPEANRNVEIRTNSLGFRDDEHSVELGGRKRIVFLGDSFTAGFAVNREDTFPQISQRALSSQGESWEAIALAAAGFGTAQEMLAYREYGSRYHPDFVVLAFFAGNDVSDNSSELSSNPRVYYSLDSSGNLIMEPRSQLRSKTSNWLNEHSRLYLWQKQQFRKVENYYKNRIRVNPAHRVFLASYDDRTTRAWEITFALIEELNRLVQKDGATLLVCYIPFSDEVNPDWWKETRESSEPLQQQKWDLEKPERILSEFCNKNKIGFRSPRSFFLNQHARGNRLYFKHGHFNNAGHREFGALIAQWIREMRNNENYGIGTP